MHGGMHGGACATARSASKLRPAVGQHDGGSTSGSFRRALPLPCAILPCSALLVLRMLRSPLLTLALSLSLTHFRFGERVGEVPSIARLRYRGLRQGVALPREAAPSPTP